MKTSTKESIFEGLSQILDSIDVRPIEDRVLIKDCGEDRTYGSLVIPDTAKERGVGRDGLYRLGIVLAVGPGDRFKEVGVDAHGDVRRRAITRECSACGGTGFDPDHPVPPSPFLDPVNPRPALGVDGNPVLICDSVKTVMIGAACPACNGQQRIPVRIPTECRPGDLVVYDRRREAEFYHRGARYSLVHEEQSVVMIVKRGVDAAV